MPRRILIVRESRVTAINSWLLNHPQLDLRGGGDKTFDAVKLNLLADPEETIRARACNWNLPTSWWTALRDKITDLGWKRNTTDADNDISDYPLPGWTKKQILDDKTRKPAKLKLIVSTAPPL